MHRIALPTIHRRGIGLLLTALGAALVPACATEGTPLRATGGERSRAAASPLERGLEAIDPVLIGQDVSFLASDELEGRDTPSRGLRIAARYIKNRLETDGFHPGAQDGWFHEWVFVRRELTPENTSATLDLAGQSSELVYGQDFALHPSDVLDGALEGELVWCGDGSRDAFRGLALDGRIAVCLEGTETRARRRHRAEDAGAGGLLVIVNPQGLETAGAAASDEVEVPDEPEQNFDAWAKTLAKARYSWPSTRPGRLPTLWIDGEQAARLLAHTEGLAPGTVLAGRLTAGVAAYVDVAIENVCAYWPGSDPQLRDEVILVSAHYDHVGTRGGQIYNGADDNASGSSALMALAEALVAHGPLRRSVLLLWVSGEEKGLFGSRAWAEDPWLPEGGRAICNINFDMVGRNAPGMLEYTPTPEHEAFNGLSERMLQLAPLEGFDDLHNADKDFSRSDHASFSKHLGVPVLYVSAGEHEDYHKATDTADKIDSDKIARFTRLVLRLILELQSPDLALEPAPEPALEPALEPEEAEPAVEAAAD